MRNPGSFRDPSGHVFSRDDRIFRALNDEAYHNYVQFKSSGGYDDLQRRGWIIEAEETDTKHSGEGGDHVIEHRKLPFVSYPYEWPFALLKRAALLHLEIHQRALDFGF